MIELVRPDPRFHRSFLAAADEFLAAGEERYANIPDIRPDPGFEGLSLTREQLEDPEVFAPLASWTAGLAEPDAPRPRATSPAPSCGWPTGTSISAASRSATS